MFPAYRFMEPYPQKLPPQRETNSYPCHYYPSWEAMPPQMPQMQHPPAFGPLPYNGNIGYPNPADHNNCYSHSYPPGFYSFRPPCSHIQPPSQLYYYGPYPPYPDALPGYFIPPNFAADQTRYDYDKASNHCCGCPNHTCHQKNDSTVKIEEQIPEKEKEKDGSSLIQLPCHPYPVMWVPPPYMKSKDANKIPDSQPGWIPLDINSLKALKQGGDERRSWHGDDRKTELPFPIIWMPGYDKPDEAIKDLKEPNATPKAIKEQPSNFKIIPLKLLENGNRGEKPESIEDETRVQVQPEPEGGKESKTKMIPVRMLGEKKEKLCTLEKSVETVEKEPISEKAKEETGVKKASDKKETSPVKSAKLPPVCLRVDPLPRRKANGSSRSPSPPGLKEKQRAHEERKGQGCTPKISEDMPKTKEIPVIDIKDKLSRHPEKQEQNCQISVPVSSSVNASEKAIAVEDCKFENLEKPKDGVEKVGQASKKNSDEGKSVKVEHNMEENNGNVDVLESENMGERRKRREFSQSDAAVFIQSVFRGFEVRRWKPLEKLRKIAQIRDQVSDVRREISSLEASPREQNAKQKAIIGETIMNLLLQLDAIQGLHPSLREVRKSVARELTCLQEKLDTLGCQVTQGESRKFEDNLTDKVSDNEFSGVVSLCPEMKPTSEQEFLEEKPDSVGGTPVEKAETARCVVDQSSDDGMPSLFTEEDAVQKTAESPDEDKMEKQQYLKNEVANSDEKRATEGPQESEETGNVVEEPDGLLSSPKDVSVSSESEGHVEGSPVNADRSNCEADESLNSKLVSKDSCADLKEVQLCAADAANPEVELPELEKVTGEELKLGKDEVGHSEVGETQESLRQVKPLVAQLKEGHDLEGAVLVKAEEPELTSNAGEIIATPTIEGKLNCDLGHGILEDQKETVNEQQNIQSLPLAEEADIRNPAVTVEVDNASSSETVYPEEEKEKSASADGTAMLHDPTVSINRENEMLEGPQCVEHKGMKQDSDASGEAMNNTTDDGSIQKEESGSVVCDEAFTFKPIPEETADANGRPELDGKDSDHSHFEDSVSATSLAPTMGMNEEEKMLVENKKLREMLERLLEAGERQLGTISDLHGRVKDLERRLAQKKRVRVKRVRPTKLSACRVSC